MYKASRFFGGKVSLLHEHQDLLPMEGSLLEKVLPADTRHQIAVVPQCHGDVAFWVEMKIGLMSEPKIRPALVSNAGQTLDFGHFPTQLKNNQISTSKDITA